jgi:transcriptional regulator with XRE-family HTH domain
MRTDKIVFSLINQNEDAEMLVGEIIRLRREQLRLQKKELAARAGVTPVTVSNVEDAPGYVPRFDTAIMLLNALGVRIRYEIDDHLLELVQRQNPEVSE